MNGEAHIAIVGSGAAGAQAACQAIDEGFSVLLLDYGNDDPHTAGLIPDAPFSEVRAKDPGQRAYFIGEAADLDVRGIRVGAHLTPPRQFITRDVDRLLPLRSENFKPMQSLALGGLAAGWGAGVYTFEDFELREAGLPPKEIRTLYEVVAQDIGVSANVHDDVAPQAAQIQNVRQPLQIDTNARVILETYQRNRRKLERRSFALGQQAIAAVENPYFDMDFYSDSRRSVYRPKYTIERLRSNPRFRYVPGALVERVQDLDTGAIVYYRDDRGTECTIRARKVLLAANAINTARIALRSFGTPGVRVPVLSNPYHFIPCLNLRMLGRPAEERRHSLAQLFGIYTPGHRTPEHVTAAIYSYRSLLTYKLVKELPLPVPLGLLATRALLTGLTIAGIHHPDAYSPQKWLELRREDGRYVLHANYELDAGERESVRKDLSGIRRALVELGCIPLTTIDPGYGSSIHYAGTLPSAPGRSPICTEPSGKIAGTRNVFAADSSGWNHLPAKGLTFTIMANARRIASLACTELRDGVSV